MQIIEGIAPLSGIPSTLFIFILSFGLFLMPGLFLYRLSDPDSSIREQVVIGFPIGLGLSAFLSAFVGWLIGFHPLYSATLIIAFSAILWLIQKDRVQSGIPRTDHMEMGSPFLFLSAMIVSLIIISYTSFGAKTPQGYAFKDLYATDLLHHMSVFVQLPGGIPPANPYFSGQPWHYYWISHLIPAFIYAVSGFSLVPKNIMFLTSVSYALLFLSGLFFLITNYFQERRTVLLTMILSLFAYGYNYLYVLFMYGVSLLPESLINRLHLQFLIRDLNGEKFTGYSHGWFRNFLVEPHDTLAISILFVLIILLKKEGTVISDRTRSLLKGLLLGMIFGFDAFIGVIAICWYGFATLNEYFKAKITAFDYLHRMVWVALPIGAILVFLYLVKIISPGSSHLVLHPDLQMILLSPFYYLIDYGPLGILGAGGIYLLIKDHELNRYFLFVILAFVCLFFMFFVNLSPVGTTQMFRKAGMVIRIPLVLFSGVFLQHLFKRELLKKWIPAVLLLIVIALPTPLVDMYRLSDWKAGASFIKEEDLEAQQWIRKNLPGDSIIQDFPLTTTPIVAFGERRVAIGDWEHAKSGGMMIEKISERFLEIKKLFQTEDPNVALQIARKFSIEYIYLNAYAREEFVKGSQKFDAHLNLFEKVYSQGGVSIYKVSTT